jgi:hypothetical protein
MVMNDNSYGRAERQKRDLGATTVTEAIIVNGRSG